MLYFVSVSAKRQADILRMARVKIHEVSSISPIRTPSSMPSLKPPQVSSYCKAPRMVWWPPHLCQKTLPPSWGLSHREWAQPAVQKPCYLWYDHVLMLRCPERKQIRDTGEGKEWGRTRGQPGTFPWCPGSPISTLDGEVGPLSWSYQSVASNGYWKNWFWSQKWNTLGDCRVHLGKYEVTQACVNYSYPHLSTEGALRLQ